MSDTTFHLTLTPRDPLVARDGRPFGAGMRMKSLDWIYPSVLAGSLRTLLGQRAGGFDPSDRDAYETLVGNLKSLAIAGPFPAKDEQLYFPLPHDVAFHRSDRNEQEQTKILEAYGIRPWDVARLGGGAGCNLPAGLQPTALSADARDGFKPTRGPAFLRADLLTKWLLDERGASFPVGHTGDWPEGFLDSPAKDVRIHVRMDYASGAGLTEGGLFQSVGLDVGRIPAVAKSGGTSTKSHEVTLAARVSHADHCAEWFSGLDSLGPLGGERRLVHWRSSQDRTQLWSCPSRVRERFEGKDAPAPSQLRMQLATPAIFRDGWKPGWLERQSAADGSTQFIGVIPGTNVVVRLIAACVDRWRPISGWGYEPTRDTHPDGSERLRFGPKPVRRLVPAGAVYFLQIVSGGAATLASRWLESVCDDEQDRRDGFGLAVWGTWQGLDR